MNEDRPDEPDPFLDLIIREAYHLQVNEEADYAEGRASPEVVARVEAHLAECGRCRESVAELRKPLPPYASPEGIKRMCARIALQNRVAEARASQRDTSYLNWVYDHMLGGLVKTFQVPKLILARSVTQAVLGPTTEAYYEVSLEQILRDWGLEYEYSSLKLILRIGAGPTVVSASLERAPQEGPVTRSIFELSLTLLDIHGYELINPLRLVLGKENRSGNQRLKAPLGDPDEFTGQVRCTLIERTSEDL